jgi:selenide,water dikinase
LRELPKFHSEKLLVSLDTSDDAAVYELNEEQALIATVDFFTPVVDDPYVYGQIAAANSLSDIYAMGGSPLLAMNIVGFPNCLDYSILGEILKGGADKIMEAGALLVGGHTIEDDEPKYGLSVNGLVHPKKIFANSTAKVGDNLILTKPIGSGVINTAIKAEIIDNEDYERAIFVMSYLNKTASEGMILNNANSCTDITGFGLVGHSLEMAKASNVSIRIFTDKVPLLSGAYDNAQMGIIPAGTYKNMDYYSKDVKFIDVEETIRDLMYDPQTSGGLLVSISEENTEKYIEFLKNNLKVEYALIGRVEELTENYLYVEK